MSHTITITKLADARSDDVEYAIGGDCAGETTAYDLCTHPGCVNQELAEPSYNVERHGIDHIGYDGRWCAATEACVLTYCESINIAAEEHGQLGTFPIEPFWDESWEIQIMPGSAS